MKPLTGEEFIRIIESDGWYFARSKGSHFAYKKDGVQAILTIPIHKGKKLRPGLQKRLMNLAGLTDADI